MSGYTQEQLDAIAAGRGSEITGYTDPKLAQAANGVAITAADQAISTAEQTVAEEPETEEQRVAREEAAARETRNTWLLYGGIGVGSLALIGGIYYLLK